YLLIGFYFLKKSAADAGKKAFIVTRIGDFGFTVGILMVFATFGTVTFGEIFPQVGNISTPVLTTICLLLFTGAIGKSAQLPLYVWLPGSSGGPTDQRPLIHTVRVVTAASL